MADRSISDVDKAAWLKVVQSWLRLIRKKPLSTQQTEFDAQKKAHGTGQDNSESSH